MPNATNGSTKDVPTTLRRYPGFEQRSAETNVDLLIEELTVDGYAIMPNVINASAAASLHDRLEELWLKQEQEFGRERLFELGEHGTHRGLLVEDERFVEMAANPRVLEVIERVVGPTAILNLQNASAAFPNVTHFQSAYHRDFAKDLIATKPMSINAFWCIDDFTEANGATQVVPFSHASPILPSDAYVEKHAISIEAPAGSVILWDSLLLHRAGYNSTPRPRFGVNHMYTRPFLKQQMDFPVFLKGRIDVESRLGQLFGFWALPPKSVVEFRVDPNRRTYRVGQG